jgi:hypothetical protein
MGCYTNFLVQYPIRKFLNAAHTWSNAHSMFLGMKYYTLLELAQRVNLNRSYFTYYATFLLYEQ